MGDVIPPRLEGTIKVAPKRRLGFAEFGPPRGRPVVWLHGTPGARRQIPAEARVLAESMDLRIVGIDRPGIGSSTPFVYDDIAGFVPDLEVVADSLGLDEMVVIGLSGGGPYALAAGALLPDRVSVVGSLGGVAPTVGRDAIQGGLVGLGRRLAPLVSVARLPLGVGLTGAVRLSRPLASPALARPMFSCEPGDGALRPGDDAARARRGQSSRHAVRGGDGRLRTSEAGREHRLGLRSDWRHGGATGGRQPAAGIRRPAGRSAAVMASPFGAQTYMLPAVGVLGAMGALLLVIVCANVAGLVLVRGVARRGEIAVRLALGAGRGRILRLLFDREPGAGSSGRCAGRGALRLACR